MNGNFAAGDRKQPGLRIVRTGGKDSGAYGSGVAIGINAAPFIPGDIWRTGCPGKNTALPSAIAQRRGGNACATCDDRFSGWHGMAVRAAARVVLILIMPLPGNQESCSERRVNMLRARPAH